MSITKITTPELLDFPNDSTSSANTSGTVIPKGYTGACTFPDSVTNLALYTMDGNADDSCGSLNLTNNNSVTFTANSPWGGSYQSADFDGSNYLSYGVGLGAVADRTRSLWINIDTIPGSFCTLIYIGAGGSVNEDYEALSLQSTGKVKFQGRYGTTTTSAIETGSALSTGTWYHIAWVYEGSSQLLYLNGVLVNTCGDTGGSGTSSGTCPSVTNTLTAGITHIAAWRDGSTVYDGKIAQVRFYNQALTSGQIVDLYNESLPQVYRPATADQGEFRYNEQLGYTEYYNGSNWNQIADEYITGQPTACTCNYPTSAAALYEFQDNTNDTCGWANGIPNTITYTDSGKYGKAGVFNGTGYVKIPYDFNFSGSFAMSFWIRPDTVSNQWQSIFGTDGYGAATHTGINFYLNYDVLEPWLGGTAGSGDIFQTGSVTVGVWQHLVLSRTYNSKWELFYNGSSLGTNTSLGLTWNLTSRGASYIGIHPTSFTYEFNGDIDQVRIFTTDLTAAQVTELYNEIPCN